MKFFRSNARSEWKKGTKSAHDIKPFKLLRTKKLWGTSEGPKQGEIDDNVTNSEIQLGKCPVGKEFLVSHHAGCYISHIKGRRRAQHKQTAQLRSQHLVFLIPTNDMLDCKVDRRGLLQSKFIINKNAQSDIKPCI